MGSIKLTKILTLEEFLKIARLSTRLHNRDIRKLSELSFKPKRKSK